MTMLPSRMPRPECVPPPTFTMSVSPAMSRTLLERHAEPFGDELGEARLVALAVGDGADHDVDAAVRVHGDLGALARDAGRGIDVVGDADAAALAAPARLRAARREARPVAQLERLGPSPP